MQTQERVIFCSTNFVSFFRNRFVVISAAQGHVWFPRISSLSTIVDAPMARFTVRRGRRRSGRTVSGALHCTPETATRGGEFSSTVDDPIARFTVRWGRRRSGRTVSGVLHCTPGTATRGTSFHPPSTTPWRASLYAGDGGDRDGRFLARFTRMPEIPPRGASFYPQSTFPWGASLCAGNRGSLQRLSSVVDGLVTRFTVRRGRRRSAVAFIDRRRSPGALHCALGTEALCGGVHRSPTTPGRASLYAGDGGAVRRCSSIVGDPMARFIVRRGRRRSAQGRENIGLLAGIRCPRLLQSGEPITVWGLQPMSRPAISSG